jgi:hypothetical protein
VTATWEISTIRGWLNDNFYGSAFSSAERSKIVMSDLYNPDNGEHGTEGGNDTRDKVFLLSNQEAITEAYGFDPSNSSASILRRAVGTDYSKSQGLAVVASGDFTGSTWWMRSPGQAKTYAGYVQWNGVINGDGIRVDYSCIGIRPALRIFTATTGVTLSDTAVSLTVGNATQLTATVTPADASNKTVIWGTTDTGVATVAWGKVTAKAPGKATITVTTQNGGFTAVCNIKVIPPAPAGLTAKAASYNSVKLSWSAVSGVTGYLVYRYNAGTDSYQQLAKTTLTGYTNTPLTAGKTYKYKVKAYKTVSGADYISDFTTVASAAPVPAAPGSFTVAKASSTSIKISWGAAAGASGYQVFRASSSTGPFSPVKTTTSKSFTDTGLTKNKTYSYKVRAYKTVNGEKIYGKFTAVKSAKPY